MRQAFAVDVAERRDLAMIAIQGPNARQKTVCGTGWHWGRAAGRAAALNSRRSSARRSIRGSSRGRAIPARTASKLMLPADDAAENLECAARDRASSLRAWARGIPCGLEAGMNLYGNDMDENHHPLESGLAWTVAFEPAERDFVGRQALEGLRDGAGCELVGLFLEERGVLRSHQKSSCRPIARPGRSDQRHLFSHLESFHRAGARAENRRTPRAGRDPRQIACREHGQAAVRAAREGVDSGLASKGSYIEQHTERFAIHQEPRVGALTGTNGRWKSAYPNMHKARSAIWYSSRFRKQAAP